MKFKNKYMFVIIKRFIIKLINKMGELISKIIFKLGS